MTLQITEAKYFTKRHSLDVTKQLQEKVDGDNLDILANNAIAGDPHYGTKKRLSVKYMLNGKECEKQVMEGHRLSIIGIIETPIIEKEQKRAKEREESLRTAPTSSKQAIRNYAVSSIRLDAVEKPNMTDIIIPTYNNEELTIACFESIKKCTKEGTYRIIWVDNGSKDFKKAKKVIADMNHLGVMLKKNHGFVGAINKGLSKSDAPTVCLLNNDTEVSPGWLDKLTDVLYSDPELGIVGPLTGPPAIRKQYDSHHNVAYQQSARQVPVFPYYKNLYDFNLKLEKQLPRMIGGISFVAFLCAVIKREVIEKVTAFDKSYKDGLDTKYDMGMWDDCDYGWAVEKVGYKSVLALDTCIIHKGRSTFKVIQEKEGFDVDMLVNRNRKYMDKKHKRIETELKMKAEKNV